MNSIKKLPGRRRRPFSGSPASLDEIITPTGPGVPVDVIWDLLSTRRLFTDFAATSLMDHERVSLFRSEQEARAHHQIPVVETKPSAPSPPLAWDGRIWFVEETGDLVHLRPEVGERLILPSARFEQLLQTGAMQQLSESTPSPMTPEIRAVLTAASPKAQQRANARLQHILLYVQGGEVTAPMRSIQRWLRAYKSAEAVHGCGYVGLLDQVALRNPSGKTGCGGLSALRLGVRTRPSSFCQ